MTMKTVTDAWLLVTMASGPVLCNRGLPVAVAVVGLHVNTTAYVF